MLCRANLYAADIFHTFFETDPADSTMGRRYRYEFLEKGASRDEMEILTDFLGREVQYDGLYKELNVA